jgi:hypothetical protein
MVKVTVMSDASPGEHTPKENSDPAAVPETRAGRTL